MVGKINVAIVFSGENTKLKKLKEIIGKAKPTTPLTNPANVKIKII